MSAVRCSRCGQLVPRQEYAAHIPCKGYPHDPPTPGTAEADHFPTDRDAALGWGSLVLPPGHLHRQGAAGAAQGPDPTQGSPGAPVAAHRAPRLATARGRVLHLLDDLQWHSRQAICDPAVGGSEGLRRLRELRSQGFNIEKRRSSAGSFDYRLTQRCVCRCPHGPCTHDWSRENTDATCTRCGAGELAHSMMDG